MKRIGRFPNQFSVKIEPDEDGWLGRECPQEECLGYFKVTVGTGLSGNPNCFCPYCGFEEDHDKFWTQAQIEYAKSVVAQEFSKALLADLKDLEFEHKPKGMFGVGISMKVSGSPLPLRRYREDTLETEVTCNTCTLRYAVYGAFGYCPDCGNHNSLQILEKTLEVVEKQLTLAEELEPELAARLIENALEDVVSGFDGFGREACRVHAEAATVEAKVEKISFQNLSRAKLSVAEFFEFDLAASLTVEEWLRLERAFQKRHLLAHRSGIVDDQYKRATEDSAAVVGRKIPIDEEEVRDAVGLARRLAAHLVSQLDRDDGNEEVDG